MRKIIKIIGWTIIILFVLLLIVSWLMGIISSSSCHKECVKRGTDDYDVQYNGEFNLNDLCICFFPGNKIESFILNE